ncbi:MAG: protein kinase [Candidatus Aenigmatarchaeota archaeon]
MAKYQYNRKETKAQIEEYLKKAEEHLKDPKGLNDFIFAADYYRLAMRIDQEYRQERWWRGNKPKRKYLKLAKKALKKGLKNHCDENSIKTKLGEIYFWAEKDEKAVEILENLNPFHLAVLYEFRAKEMEKRGKGEKAKEDYKRAKEFYIKNRSYHLAGGIAERLGEKEDAAELFGKSRLFGRKAAKLYEELGKKEKAAKLYEKHFNLSLRVPYLLKGTDSAKRAAELYFEMAMYSKDSTKKREFLEKAADMYENVEDWDNALKVYEMLGDKNNALWVKGCKYEREGDFAEAAKCFRSIDAERAVENWLKVDIDDKNLRLKIEDLEKIGPEYKNYDQVVKELVKLYETEISDRIKRSGEDFLSYIFESDIVNKAIGKIEEISKGKKWSEDTAKISENIGYAYLKGMLYYMEAIKKIDNVMKTGSSNGEKMEAKRYLQKSKDCFDNVWRIDEKYKDVNKWREFLSQDHFLIKRIGKGGMGSVYLGWNVSGAMGDFREAIKLSKKIEGFDPQKLEYEALKKVKSPYIVTLRSAIEIQPSPYSEKMVALILDYIDGKSMFKIFDREDKNLNLGLYDLKDALEIFIKLAEGIEAIHKENLIHRDIKPSNIIISEKDPIILDFGIAEFSDKIEWDGVGTPDYLPPEAQAGKYGQFTDIYAFGVTIYEFLTGKKPDEKPPELSEKYPQKLRDLIKNMCDSNCGKRPKIEDVKETLKEIYKSICGEEFTDRSQDEDQTRIVT